MSNWYTLHPYHIKNFDESLAYLKSPLGMRSSKVISEFYYEYREPFIGRTGRIPVFNPFQFQEFLLEKNLKDGYLNLGSISRHLIASNKLTTLLEESHLSGHVKFGGIKMKNRMGEELTYNLFYFYESMWDYVDIRRCVFKYVNHITNENIRLIQFENLEEYYQAMEETKRGEVIAFEKLAINGISKYDCFMILNYSESFIFISEKLFNKIKANKIKVDVQKLTYFTIV